MSLLKSAFRRRSVDPGAQSSGSPLRALIVGIDKYESNKIKDLTGAVADAEDMYRYLRNDLKVPDNQIVVLRDKKARRADILRELRALGTRGGSQARSFRKGEPLLFFFAGHGTTADAPSDWRMGNTKLSLIVPHDSMFAGDFNVRDIRRGSSKRVYPIPDRTLAALLDEIAGKYGNNITVIFDCCHSGSGTRDSIDYTPALGAERGFSMGEGVSIPAGLDEEFWGVGSGDRAAAVPAGAGMAGAHSHVLLAACREDEKAREVNKRGRFSIELLRALRQVHPTTTTYLDLMRFVWRTNIPGQTPQCEGHHKDRILFGAFVMRRGERSPYRVSNQGGRFVMDAGAVNGITDHAQVSIHPETGEGSPALIVMTALHVYDFKTILSPTFTSETHDMSMRLPSLCFALLLSNSKAAALRVSIHPRYRGTVLETIRRDISHPDRIGYPVVVDDDHRHLALGILDDSDIVYSIYYPVIRAHGHTRLWYTTQPETIHIHCVLHAASRFFWHLSRTPRYHQLRMQINVSMYRVHKDEDGELDRGLRPPYVATGENLLRSPDAVLDIVADGNTHYGLRLTNSFNEDLHVWALYFDCSDLSIMDYYQPQVSGPGAQPSLPRNGDLTIGYGPGGVSPFRYFLRKGQLADFGIIKIFLSTEPFDLSEVLQKSAFVFEDRDPRATEKELQPAPSKTWDTIQILIRQCKT